jgi:arylsulfatase A-like enzyme
MLSAMDDAVGRVLAAVRKHGEEENTLVFFIADNGGPTRSTTSQNGPLRGFKMTTYEGGPRVPFLVQWKGRIPAGKTYDLPVMNLDVVPTVMAAAGRPVAPADRIDGVDLVPFLTGATSGRPHEALFWRFMDQWAVRSGDWKLVVSQGGSGRPELYDLANDIGEQKDLAASHPDRVAELLKLYDGWNAEQSPQRPDDDKPRRPKRRRRAGAA